MNDKRYDDDIPVMILASQDEPSDVKSAVPIQDTDCGHPCWISLAGMQYKLTTKVKTICTRCWLRMIFQGEVPPPDMQMPVPGAMEELTAQYGAEVADKAKQNFEQFAHASYELREDLKRAHQEREGR